MEISRILARLDGSPSDNDVLGTAAQLAQRFSAHIDALLVKFDPKDVPLVTGLGPADDLGLLMASLARSSSKARERAREHFRRWHKEASIPLMLHRTEPPSPSTTLMELEERETLAIARAGRLTDMILVAQPTARNDFCSLPALETAIFETRTPVLMIPPDCAMEKQLLRPVIAWNGSAEAGLAVSSALPLLRKAGSGVSIFTAAESRHDASAADLAAYLRWHGIQAEPAPAEASDDDIASRLLDAAERQNSGLLVMGAYTHGRLHQLLLGGVTRHMFHHASIPVLFCH